MKEKVEYYLGIARAVARKSRCSRRKFGAILVRDDAVLSTGYNGSARGTINCGTEIKCLKDLNKEEEYVSYKFCPAVHAEQNAIINAGRSGVSTLNATLYLSPYGKKEGYRPCHLCRRMCINAGIKDCYFIDQNSELQYEKIKNWIKLENNWMKDRYVER